MAVTKTIIGAEGVGPYVRAGEKEEVRIQLILETRIWSDRIESPGGRNFPADTAARKDRVMALHVHAHAEDELQLRAVDVSAAENERDIERVAVEIIEARAIETWLSFDPDKH